MTYQQYAVIAQCLLIGHELGLGLGFYMRVSVRLASMQLGCRGKPAGLARLYCLAKCLFLDVGDSLRCHEIMNPVHGLTAATIDVPVSSNIQRFHTTCVSFTVAVDGTTVFNIDVASTTADAVDGLKSGCASARAARLKQ